MLKINDRVTFKRTKEDKEGTIISQYAEDYYMENKEGELHIIISKGEFKIRLDNGSIAIAASATLEKVD